MTDVEVLAPGDVAHCETCGNTFVQRALIARACRRCGSMDIHRWRAGDITPRASPRAPRRGSR